MLRESPLSSRFAPCLSQRSYLERLAAKHGSNYKVGWVVSGPLALEFGAPRPLPLISQAMERDIKVNNMQHSAEHLETRFKRLEGYKAVLAAQEAALKAAVDAAATATAAASAVATGSSAASVKSTSSVKSKASTGKASKKEEEEEGALSVGCCFKLL